jgi:hypothetical protein
MAVRAFRGRRQRRKSDWASLIPDNLDWAAVVIWFAAFYSRVDRLCLALTIFAYFCMVCRSQFGTKDDRVVA